MSCNNIIRFNYFSGNPGDPVITNTVQPTGVINGKPCYFLSNETIVYWSGTAWVYGSITDPSSGFTITNLASYTPTSSTDCPFNSTISLTNWVFITPLPEGGYFTSESNSTYTQNICGCPIEITYEIGNNSRKTVLLEPVGTIAGYNYYLFVLNINGTNVEVILYHNINANQWILQVNSPYTEGSTYYGIELTTLDITGSCPSSLTTVPWTINPAPELNIEFLTTKTECDPEPDYNDPQDCYSLLVWDKQCKFGKAVYNYIQQLQFGIDCCELADELLNQKRALEILNCYDSRDIANNTTNYNFIKYSEIKKLLN